jgi:uncharacterized membrane protein YhaH (DUF805 family)
MKAAISDGLHRWKDYSGRSSRSQLWWFILFYTVFSQACQWIPPLLFFVIEPDGALAIVITILFFSWMLLIPSILSVQVRRMHDVGKSGWFILAPIYNLYLYVQPSVKE